MKYLENLEVFKSVVNTNSFSQTSEIFNMSQSTISKKIKNIEEFYGVNLIERSTREFKLTKAGLIVYNEAIEQEKIRHETIKQLANLETNKPCKIGITEEHFLNYNIKNLFINEEYIVYSNMDKMIQDYKDKNLTYIIMDKYYEQEIDFICVKNLISAPITVIAKKHIFSQNILIRENIEGCVIYMPKNHTRMYLVNTFKNQGLDIKLCDNMDIVYSHCILEDNAITFITEQICIPINVNDYLERKLINLPERKINLYY